MKTACCGMSLYRATYVIFCAHLMLNTIGIFHSLAEFRYPLYGVSHDFNVYFAISLIISLIEFTIFCAGAVTLDKLDLPAKSAILMNAIMLLVADSCLSIYGLFALEHKTLGSLWKMAMENENLDHKLSDKRNDEELPNFVEVVFSCVIGSLCGGLLLFKMYSLMVIYYYKAELKLTLLNDLLIESSAYENTSPPPYHLLYPNDSVCTSQAPEDMVLPISISELVEIQENELNKR